MGLIADLMVKLQENEVRARMLGLQRSLISSMADSDSLKIALEARDDWKKITEQAYQYQKYGESADIEILADDSPLEIIKKIATAEIQVASKGLSDEQKNHFITIGLEELDKIITT